MSTQQLILFFFFFEGLFNFFFLRGFIFKKTLLKLFFFFEGFYFKKTTLFEKLSILKTRTIKSLKEDVIKVFRK